MTKLLKIKKYIMLVIAFCLTVSVTCVGINYNSASAASTNIKESTNKVSTNLTPYAWYKFDDANNLGKDSMGRFDLKSKVNGGSLTHGTDGGDGYASFSTNGSSETDIGALLYAPELDGTGKDFSDNIKGSYTLSITFRDKIASGVKDVSNYVVTTGKFYDAITICPFGTHSQGKLMEVQTWTRDFMLPNATTQMDIDDPTVQDNIANGERPNGVNRIQQDTSSWTTVTIVGDANAQQTRIYVNGSLKQTRATTNVAFSNQASKPGAEYAAYTFAIGGQCDYNGGANDMHADADVKDCKIFDYALTDANVSALYGGTTATYTGKSITSLTDLNTSSVDFTVTDQHTVKKLLTELPSTVSVSTSSGNETVNIVWTTLGKSNKIYGYPSGDAANVKGLYYEYDYKYVVKLKYNESAITISEYTVDGVSYEPDEIVEVDAGTCEISFLLEFGDEYIISEDFNGIWFSGIDWFFIDDWQNENGYVTLTKPANTGLLIELLMKGETGTGNNGVVEPEQTPSNDNTQKPSTNNNNTNNATTTTTEDEGGCGSSIAGTGVISLLSVAGFGLIVKKKRSK